MSRPIIPGLAMPRRSPRPAISMSRSCRWTGWGKASFIKLHLEGGELDALKGGQQSLTRRRPIVVATVYHNDDGI